MYRLISIFMLTIQQYINKSDKLHSLTRGKLLSDLRLMWSHMAWSTWVYIITHNNNQGGAGGLKKWSRASCPASNPKTGGIEQFLRKVYFSSHGEGYLGNILAIIKFLGIAPGKRNWLGWFCPFLKIQLGSIWGLSGHQKLETTRLRHSGNFWIGDQAAPR